MVHSQRLGVNAFAVALQSHWGSGGRSDLLWRSPKGQEHEILWQLVHPRSRFRVSSFGASGRAGVVRRRSFSTHLSRCVSNGLAIPALASELLNTSRAASERKLAELSNDACASTTHDTSNSAYGDMVRSALRLIERLTAEIDIPGKAGIESVDQHPDAEIVFPPARHRDSSRRSDGG